MAHVLLHGHLPLDSADCSASGCVFYLNGSLTAETFVTVMIVSMSIIGPILTVSNYVDSIAAMSTVVGLVTDILDAPELVQPEQSQPKDGTDIEFKDVRFSYREGEEVLKGMDLQIPAGSVTAIVGPSGGGNPPSPN